MANASVKAGHVTFSQVDQFEIVEDLIAHLNEIREDIQIEVTYDALSGVLRDRSYEMDKGKSIGEAIEQLALVEDGFEWAFVPVGTVDDLTFRLILSYPQRGRSTGYRFDLFAKPARSELLPLQDGSGAPITDDYDQPILVDYVVDQTRSSPNVIGGAVGVTSADRVSRFTAIGPGEGVSQLVSHRSNPNLLGKMRLVERSNSWVDVVHQATLDGHAVRQPRQERQRSI